jgi:hypothetical protein
MLIDTLQPMLGGTNHNESAGFITLGGVWLGEENEIALNVGFRCGKVVFQWRNLLSLASPQAFMLIDHRHG